MSGFLNGLHQQFCIHIHCYYSFSCGLSTLAYPSLFKHSVIYLNMMTQRHMSKNSGSFLFLTMSSTYINFTYFLHSQVL